MSTRYTRAERREFAAFQRQSPQQWCIPADQQSRYDALFAKEEAEHRAYVAREWRWERRRPALRTLVDVVFWLGAIPWLVLSAFAGILLPSAVLVTGVWYLACGRSRGRDFATTGHPGAGGNIGIEEGISKDR